MDESVMRRKVAEARWPGWAPWTSKGVSTSSPWSTWSTGDTWYSPSDAGPRPVKRLRNVLADPGRPIGQSGRSNVTKSRPGPL